MGSVSHSTADVGTRRIYLTVNWLRSVKSDHVGDHGGKGGHACKGVQLTDGISVSDNETQKKYLCYIPISSTGKGDSLR